MTSGPDRTPSTTPLARPRPDRTPHAHFAHARLVDRRSPPALVDRRRPAARDDDDEPSTRRRTVRPDVVAGEAFPAERCEANEAAGTITYLTGFDFAAAASIVEVIVAEDAGYYDELCLDVEIQPSFSTANYPLDRRERRPVLLGRVVQRGRRVRRRERRRLRGARRRRSRRRSTSLMVKPGEPRRWPTSPAPTIGVKGKLPTSVAGDARPAGPRRGRRLRHRAARGFDPVAHMAIEAIVGVPGWQEQRAGRPRARRRRLRPVRHARLRDPWLVRSDLHATSSSSTSTRPPPRTSCGPRCAASPTRSPTRRRRRTPRSS